MYRMLNIAYAMLFQHHIQHIQKLKMNHQNKLIAIILQKDEIIMRTYWLTRTL